jgi:flagellar biosynthesis protein FlhG
MTTATSADLALAPEPARNNIVAVASGKGGVGKTWFSITLSHALARAGRRTLLFDGDLGLANVDVQLGIAPPRDLGMVLSGRFTMREAAWRYEAGGFDILAGQSGSGSLSSLPVSKLTAIRQELQALAASYDAVVLDLGAGIDRPVRMLAGEAGSCLIVATDEPTSITDAYAFIKVSAQEQIGGEVRLVVNMASSTREGERTYGTLRKACREFLKLDLPLAGIVRRDDKVKEAIRHQTSLLTRHPNTDAAADVEAIARRLVLPG